MKTFNDQRALFARAIVSAQKEQRCFFFNSCAPFLYCSALLHFAKKWLE
jgi:hypothetical protein